jgi:autophagy-related protein 5
MPIRKQIWDGTIPIRIILASNETRSNEPVEYLLKAHRCSYLALYIPKVLRYFAKFLNDPSDAESWNWWFEFEQVPARWNWPVGLSFDMMTGLDPLSPDSAGATCLPWTLTLHRKDFPVEYILRLEDEATVMDYWLNQTKESCCLRDGNSRAVMNLSKSDTIELWDSVRNHSYDAYWSSVDKMQTANSEMKNVPLKVYLPGGNRVVHVVVTPNRGSEESQQPTTLGMALSDQFPELFPSKRTCILARPVLHGVVPSLTVPLRELLQEAMFLDGFLHVGIVMMC